MLNKGLPFLGIFLFAFFLASAQKEAENWYFGQAALNFSTFPPATLTTTFTALEGCSSRSDQSGNLLLYTNGEAVWNKNHQIMANGSNIGGHQTATQSSLIVKKPGSNTLYYVFTVNQGTSAVFAYSIVDMSLAAGLGSVTVKGVTVTSQVTEKLNGTYHCNGSDVWIVVHKYESNEFYSYLLTSAGLSTFPVISTVGLIHTSDTLATAYAAIGQLKISPTGKKLVVAIYYPVNAFELFDFSPVSGIVSNPITFNNHQFPYGCEFSSDGSKLYGSYQIQSSSPKKRVIKQWDLCAGSDSMMINSATIVDTTFDYTNYALQIGPYRRIYSGEAGYAALGTVHSPNLPGLACNAVSSDIILTTGHCQQGLPNFIGGWFRETAAATHTVVGCGSVAFSYTPITRCANSSDSMDSLRWDFGDPASGIANSTTAPTSDHIYKSNGSYNVKLLVYYPCYTDTVKLVVNITAYPLLAAPSLTICKNEKAIITGTGAATYSWSTGAQTATIAVSPTTTTIYTLTGYSPGGCGSSRVATVTVDPCLGLNHHFAEVIFSYPVPTDGNLNLHVPESGTTTLYDLTGARLLMVPVVPGLNPINVTELCSGVYYLAYRSDQGTVKIIRVVRE